jgi:YD repeat-containing protein
LGNTTSYAYDSGGNLITQTEPLGSLTAYQYDSRGRANVITESLPRQPDFFIGDLAPQAVTSETIYTTIADPFPGSTNPIAFLVENSVRATSEVADPNFTNNTFTSSTTAFSGPEATLDSDCDGVPDPADVCTGTVIPEGVPTKALGINRWALADGDRVFDTTPPGGGGAGTGLEFTIEDTAGCSCEQIIDTLGLGKGHKKHGCSGGAMKTFVELVNP